MNKFKFERLVICKKTMDSGEEIDVLSASFPEKETYNLS